MAGLLGGVPQACCAQMLKVKRSCRIHRGPRREPMFLSKAVPAFRFVRHLASARSLGSYPTALGGGLVPSWEAPHHGDRAARSRLWTHREGYHGLSHTRWECKHQVVFIPNSAGKLWTATCGVTSASCSSDWPSRKRAGSRQAPHGGPRAHDDLYSAQVLGGAGVGFTNGKSAIHSGPGVGVEEAQPRRSALLGSRAFRVDSREGTIVAQKAENRRLDQMHLRSWSPPSSGPHAAPGQNPSGSPLLNSPALATSGLTSTD